MTLEIHPPVTTVRLEPRLGAELKAEPVSLDTPDERFALTILEAHPSGLARAMVRETAKAIVEESRANGLDPLLVLALIRVESSNWNWSRSDKNARGLMQILPTTARPLTRECDVAWRGADSLYDPRVNVRLGTRYLAGLVSRFSTKDVGEEAALFHALAAYNEGPGGMERKIARNTVSESYATKILWFRSRYRALARPGDDLAPGIARVKLALSSIEDDIDGKPSVALVRAQHAKASAATSVDLNRVSFSDLLVLDSEMTARAARAIVDYRVARHGFHRVEELDDVGLDAVLTRRLRTRVRVKKTAAKGAIARL